jgi:biotin carboxyl carrier protein
MSRELHVLVVDDHAEAGEAAEGGVSGDDLDLLAADAPTIRDVGAGRVRVAGPPGGTDRVALVVTLPTGADGRRHVEVVVDGWRFLLVVEDAARARLRRRATRTADAPRSSGSADIRAIIPGRVAAVRVAAGDAVTAGQTLLVVEAMKMHNELRAPRTGTIRRVAVGDGQTIERGDLLVVLE